MKKSAAPSSRPVRFFGWMMEIIFDPLFFLTLAAPWIIKLGLDWIQHAEALTGNTGLGQWFNNSPANFWRGLADYSVALTVFTAAFILWVARCYNCGLLQDYLTLIRHRGQDKSSVYSNPCGWRLRISFVGFGALTGYVLWSLPSHKLCDLNLLQNYVDNVGHLGPWDSPITWLRGAIAGHNLFLIKAFEVNRSNS